MSIEQRQPVCVSTRRVGGHGGPVWEREVEEVQQNELASVPTRDGLG